MICTLLDWFRSHLYLCRTESELQAPVSWRDAWLVSHAGPTLDGQGFQDDSASENGRIAEETFHQTETVNDTQYFQRMGAQAFPVEVV